MKIKFKKTHTLAKTPAKAHDSDVGFDLTAVSTSTDHYGNVVYDTGIAIEIPKNHCGLVFPRSSISKTCLHLTNSVGIIDPDYRGSILFKFKPSAYMNTRDEKYEFEYEVGEKIGQLVILPLPTVELQEVEQLSDTERGTGGFGSTDVKK